MKKPDLIDHIVEQTGYRKGEVTEVLEVAIQAITATLKKHNRVQISGLGVFEPRRRKARLGKNPRTQEQIRIPQTWSLASGPASNCGPWSPARTPERSAAGRASDSTESGRYGAELTVR